MAGFSKNDFMLKIFNFSTSGPGVGVEEAPHS